jgi:hypothetical protein
MWAERMGVKGVKGVKGVRVKGWEVDTGQGTRATMSKKLTFQVSRGSLLFLQGIRLTIACIMCRYRLTVHCVNINKFLCAS